jgi:two-component system nitrate/nitrite sensor histidine kinase NarX
MLVDRYGIRLAHGRNRAYIFRSLMPLPPATWQTLQASDRFATLPAMTDTHSELLWNYVQQQPLPPLLVGEFNDARERVYFSGARLATRDWTVLAMLPETEMLAPARRVTAHGLAAVIILTSLLGVTVVWLTQRIMRPVPQLVIAARKIAGGDLSTPVAAKGSSELGELAENFEAMRHNLQKSQDELGHWAQTLEARVAQRSQELAALSEVIAFAGLSESRSDLMHITLELSLKVMDAEMGGIWLADRDDGLTMAAQTGFDNELSRELTTFAPNEGLLGRVQASGRPVVLENISQAPLLARAVVREHALGAFAAVPLRIHGRNLGVLGVFSHSNRLFSPQAVSLAASIAQQIALTLDNMALVQQVQTQAHRVARLQERERIAAEIHDSVAQTHGYIYLQVDNLAEEAADTPRQEIRTRLITLRDVIDNLSVETRHLIAQLRDVSPPPPTRLDETVRREIERLAPVLNVPVQLNLAQAGGMVLSEGTSAELARIVGEAVRNAQRHGQAGQIQINFERYNGNAYLSIQDDGVGFDPAQAPADERSHFGLSVMEARAGRIGGSLNIDSRPGGGTRVVVCWPARE